MKDPLLADAIILGKSDNRIEKHVDGSMLFSDSLVQGVRLIDLVNGIESGITLVTVEINTFDWVLSSGLYGVTIPHNWDLETPISVIVNVYDENYEQISVDTVKVNANDVTIKVVVPMKIYVAIKKI